MKRAVTRHLRQRGDRDANEVNNYGRAGMYLPFPDSRLSPNGRRDRRGLTAVRAIARNIGYVETMVSGLRFPDRTPLHLFLTFYPPDNRRRDGDNLIGAFKSYQDGIFRALGIDDSNVKLTTFGLGKKVDGGFVDVRIEVIRPPRKAG